MSIIAVTPFQKRALAIATAIAVLFGAYFLWSYFILIVFAGIVAYSFNPLYLKLEKKWKSPSRAVTVTLVATFLTLIIPILLIMSISAYELAKLADNLAKVDLNNLETTLIDQANAILEKLHISLTITPEWIKTQITDLAAKLGSALLSALAGVVGNVVSMFSTAIIYIFVFMSLLLKQKELVEVAQKLNPLGRTIGELYLNRIQAMTKAMVKGQFIIAFLQGTTDALLLYIAGLHGLFFFFMILLTALSVIPLGGGIIAIPIGIFMLLTGKIWQGLVVLGGHFFIVTNIDNVLRPKLVPKQARLDSALTLLSVFSGLHFFGFLGIVIGPVIMILIVTTIQVFTEVFHNEEAINREEDGRRAKSKLLGKLTFWKKPKTTN